MRTVALVVAIFLLLSVGIGLIEAGPLSGSKGNFPDPPHPLAPSAPMSLVATAGVGQVSLTWQAATGDLGYPVTNYRVYQGTAPGVVAFLANAGNVLSHTDTGLTNGVTYYYQVSAVGLGEGPRSNEAFATPTGTATAPTAPQNLQATAGVIQVSLTWQAPLSDGGSPITNYKVYRGMAAAPVAKTLLASVGTLLTHTDTAVVAGQTYYYQVSAENSIDEGSQSNEAFATPTAADPSISIVEPTADATVGTVVFLQVQIAGFIIDAENVGQASVSGRGHYHVTVDGTTIDFMVTGLIYAVKDLTEGRHTIRVSLHNNDHSPLTPEVSDEVTVTVAAPTSPPAGIEPAVFAGTTIGLIALLIVVAVGLILWGRRGRQAP